MLGRYWRIFATGLSFALFGVGGIVLTILLIPILVVTKESVSRQRLGKQLLKKVFQGFLGSMRFLGVLELRVENLNRIKSSGSGNIILANHPSLIDVIVIFSLIDNPNGVIKPSILNNPCMFGLARISGLICNSEGTELIRRSIESLAIGDNLLIFPEGTRTKELNRVVFKRGAAYLAIKGEINIIPLLIAISDPFLWKGASWYKVPLKRPIITISAMDEIDVTSIVDKGSDIIVGSEKLTKHLEKLYMKEIS